MYKWLADRLSYLYAFMVHLNRSLPATMKHNQALGKGTIEAFDMAKAKKAWDVDNSVISSEDAYTKYTNTSTFRAMRPLFVSLELFGLYHRKDYWVCHMYLSKEAQK